METIEKRVYEAVDIDWRRVNDPDEPLDAGWEEPLAFETVNIPPFPTEQLPAPMAAFVKALAESTQTPEEMAGVLSLGILASALQSRYEVEVTTDWKEPLCLYLVAVAEPGERKSAVLSALSGPSRAYETMRREEEAVAIAKNQTERAILESKLKAAQAAAAKPQKAVAWEDLGIAGFADHEQEALELAAQLETFEELHPYRLIVDDTTPEKLIEIMAEQGGSITISSAEGGVFDSFAGRYDKGANFDIYLKGHAADPIKVDRMCRKSNHIESPRLTMMLTIQPDILRGLMANPTLRGRGLCGRFLYAICQSKVGHRNTDPVPVPPQMKEEYHRFVQRILSATGKGVIRLSKEAQEARVLYCTWIERMLGDKWEHMRDWGGKLMGAALRIAALFHAAEAENPTETPISEDTLMRALTVTDCLCKHAMAAYQVMGADVGYEDAKYVLRRIEGYECITKRDMYHLCRGKFKTVEAMEPALRVLSNMGYIREEEERTGGRPTKIIFVNPLRKRP